MSSAEFVPVGIDPTTPSVARMYDYYLGGKDNYAADREASEQLAQTAPSTRVLAVNNRRFLQRAVRHVAEREGIRQFLDHGSGLPTQDNVHQIAQRVDPASRVVYVDNDPIVLAHGRALLADNDRTTVITADMRDQETVTGHPDVLRLIDFDEPLAVLFVSVLHCVPDSDDPGGLLRRVMDRLAPGSVVVLSHLVSADAEVRARLTDFMLSATGGNWGRVRAAEDIVPWFEGLEVLDPGLVEVSSWRPGPDDVPQETTEWIEFGGVARKPR
ncbi:SAM-dependent methyltransferase [Spirillospora sp. CA-253888]